MLSSQQAKAPPPNLPLLRKGRRRALPLRIPPANRLEALQGGRKGQQSIRINDQWLVCFRCKGGDAHDVEIVDYH